MPTSTSFRQSDLCDNGSHMTVRQKFDRLSNHSLHRHLHNTINSTLMENISGHVLVKSYEIFTAA